MSYGEKQQKEIETIKERTIKLKLSDADCERISCKAGKAGMTVGELLQQFIGDLVDGTYTNGSDERQAAEDWYNRCSFGMFPEKTFLNYLLEYGEMDTFLEKLEEKEDAESNIKITEKEISTGIIKGRGNSYTWKDLIGGDGKPCYGCREEWELSQKEYIEQEQDTLEAAEQDMKEIWEDFLSWTDKDEKNLSFEIEIQKVRDWEERVISFKG